MKTKTQYEQLMESPEFRKLYAIEGLVTEAGEFIARLMREQRVTKAELARRLGKSRAYITQMLSGSRNLTVRTLAEAACALGVEVKLAAVPFEAARHGEARAAAVEPVWKVVEFRKPPSRVGDEARSPGAAFRPGDQGDFKYQYVA
jgi:transcriptional regulator with XRE-family HTH domain